MLNFLEKDYPIPWSMSLAEKTALILLLQDIKPRVSIEIGTFKGGSLQALSKFSEKVYALDINPNRRDPRCAHFENVEFIIGDSKEMLPKLVKSINDSDEIIEFVLIDGDHTTQAVLSDIESILQLKPKKPVVILLHDSFNPPCRKGMKLYNYDSNQYVHVMDLDFIPGVFNLKGLYREMWGGFAMIYMSPKRREKPLKILAPQEKLYNAIYYQSKHFIKDIFWFLKPVYRLIKK